MGAVGGSIWHFVRGAKNSPRGARIAGAIDAVKLRAPVLGGSFAVWGGMYSLYDCGLAGIRRKEDAWNSIASGAMVGATLSARSGMKVASRSALFGGAILALIEGISIAINRFAGSASPSPQDLQRMREEAELAAGAARDKNRAEGLAGVGQWAAEPQSS